MPLREEERVQLDVREARRLQVGDDVLDAVLPRVEVEDELPLRVAGDVAEERAAVARVVDGAKAGRAGDGRGRQRSR